MERRSLLRRAWDATVWSRAGVPAADWRYRGLYRFVLPSTDLFFCYFGVVGWLNGVLSVRDAAGNTFNTWWSAGIAITAFGALVGVAVPRLWAWEMLAKIGLVGLVFTYVFLSGLRVFTDFRASATAGLVFILILLPLWRLSDLSLIAWKHGVGRRRT